MLSNSDIAAELNIKHKRGDTFKREFTIVTGGVPFELTGYTVRMQVKRAGARGEPLLNISTDDHISIIGDDDEIINIDVPDNLMRFIAGVHTYDLQVTSGGGEVTTWLQGDFELTQDVTE